MAGLCLFGQLLELHSLARPLVGAYVAHDPSATPPWSSLLAENTPGGAPLGAPLFVAQGLRDELVRPSATSAYVTRMCAAGERVVFRQYPGDDHATIANTAASDVLSFFASVLTGSAPASTC